MNCLTCGKRLRKKRADAVFCSAKCRVAYNRNKRVTDNQASKTILSLCDYTGNWARPYKESGYRVIQIDEHFGHDVRLFRSPGRVYGILAAPPCTMFAKAGNRHYRTPREMREALSVVDACLRLVVACQPIFWALENPVGKLRHYLGEPAFRFDPCDYGDPYTKRTCLWGVFNAPKPVNKVPPIKAPTPSQHSIDAYLQERGYTLGKQRSMLRSMTPMGFAYAFFAVNQ